MHIEQRIWNQVGGWSRAEEQPLAKVNLVMVFGSTSALLQLEPLAKLRALYPGARLVGCSTAGEICGTRVLDDSIVATAVAFEGTQIRCVQTSLGGRSLSREAGARLALQLPPEELVHVFVLSDGLAVNGSELVKGLVGGLPAGVGLTGGLSGDGARFERTLVCLDGKPLEGEVIALGLYSKRLKVGCGSMGGWDPFGPERLVTRSAANVLHALDGESALGLYKQYLGDHASGLPGSALLFPLAVRIDGAPAVVRTVLSIDEAAQTMTFAGDVPEGAHARLMKANFDRLIDGANSAARTSFVGFGVESPELAILISCVGRKLVLKQRIEEEVESVREVLGPSTAMTGFYSYGEISPFNADARCELHNQTMTITTFSER